MACTFSFFFHSIYVLSLGFSPSSLPFRKSDRTHIPAPPPPHGGACGNCAYARRYLQAIAIIVITIVLKIIIVIKIVIVTVNIIIIVIIVIVTLS